MGTKPEETQTEEQVIEHSNEEEVLTGNEEELQEETQTEVLSGNSDSKKVELHHSDFKRIKNKAKAQGERAALESLTKRAKDAGFDSLDDVFAKLKSLNTLEEKAEEEPEEEEEETEMATTPKKKQPTRKKPVKHRQPDNVDPRQRRMKQDLEKERSKREKATRKWRQEERRRRELQKKLDAKDAEMELREAAHLSGVKDVDYALRLLYRELNGKSEDELEGFDEKEFFNNLRNDRPYLFGESVTPATTGNADEDAPPAPDNVEPEANNFNARDASKKDLDKRLNDLGINGQM